MTQSKAQRVSRAKKSAPQAGVKAKSQARPAADWRDQTLKRVRALILEADPAMIEERKWRKPSNGMAGVPVWSHNGIVCTGETYKQVVKLSFAKGASLPDPSRLFNASLEGGTRRAIDIREGEQIDAGAFQALVKAAVAANATPAKQARANSKAKTAQPKPAAKNARPAAKSAKPVKLLSGGNPQIAKGDGDAPVQAYIAAMPGWKSDVGRRLDELIEKNVPEVQKAVKWNSPFYGVKGQGFFLGLHCMTKYIKVAFFRGRSLRPEPPGESKQKDVRYLDIYEDDPFDEAQMVSWIKQAAALPGWVP
jgi:hypothetical protein